jgi:hypothetical protein
MADNTVAGNNFAQYDANIQNLYQSDMGRAADPAGLQYWEQQMANGMTPDQLNSQFQSSAEAQKYMGAQQSTGAAATERASLQAEISSLQQQIKNVQAQIDAKKTNANVGSGNTGSGGNYTAWDKYTPRTNYTQTLPQFSGASNASPTNSIPAGAGTGAPMGKYADGSTPPAPSYTPFGSGPQAPYY